MVTKDDGSSYSGAHYDTSRTGDIAHPIAWKTGSKPKASATFTVTPVNTKKKVKIRGTGGGLWFPMQELMPSAGKITYVATASTNALPTTISAGKIDIAWQYSTDNGASYQPIGSSSNKAYVSLSGEGGIETVLHLACNYASGKSTSADAFTGIWDYFKTKAVARKDGLPMHYWLTTTHGDSSKADLIKNQDGRCGSWRQLFVDVLVIQSVNDVAAFRIVTKSGNVAINGKVVAATGKGFTIKPIAGQNTPLPWGPAVRGFTNHSVAKKGSSLYDPSYGEPYVASDTNQALIKWEDTAVEGFHYQYYDADTMSIEIEVLPNKVNLQETEEGVTAVP